MTISGQRKKETNFNFDLYRYPFAIVGINITQCAVQALRTRQMQYYLYKYGADKKSYSEFYCK